MKTSNIKSKILRYSSLVFIVVALAACDSSTDSTNASFASNQSTVEFDLTALDEQVDEAREPGPSLGFALNARFILYGDSS